MTAPAGDSIEILLDEVNIDRSLVAGLGRDPAATALVTGVIGLAHALGLRTVARRRGNMRAARHPRRTGL